MKLEYNTFTQTEWLQEIEQEKEFAQYKADWEAWKAANGFQDGRFPYAHQLGFKKDK